MKLVVPFLATAALATSASAGLSPDFFGFKVVITNDGQNNTFDVYANFTGPKVLLNTYDLTSTGDLGFGSFIHNDLANGSWDPNFCQVGSQSPLVTNDSFVLIGGNTGVLSGNSTTADPGWGDIFGFNQTDIPDGAGWFNTNPPNLQGATNADNKVLIARFIVSRDVIATRTFFIKIGFYAGEGSPTEFGEGYFTVGVPAPGVLALLGLAGMTARRRRA